ASLQIEFSTQASQVDESIEPDEPAAVAARRLACAKAAAVAVQHPQAVIVASDTCMQVDGRIAGKPADRKHAVRMLKSWAGCRAAVCTALCVVGSRGSISLLRSGWIDFAACQDEQIEAYLAASPGALQAEGALSINEAGALLCRAIGEDEPGTIAGLPMISLCRMLAEQRIKLP
ncbi:MAG: Maf family protein, partial [Betaproteobacteria bacterium]|nr:Maf family protein [Betaproteobacteria bacterium]